MVEHQGGCFIADSVVSTAGSDTDVITDYNFKSPTEGALDVDLLAV